MAGLPGCGALGAFLAYFIGYRALLKRLMATLRPFFHPEESNRKIP
jgi:hypothetical protein